MAKSALLVLDLINEIIHPDGKFAAFGYPAQVAERGVLEKANAAIAKARAKGIPVIFVRVGFSADYSDCNANSPLFGAAKQYGALQLGTWATEIHQALDQQDGDAVVTKHRVSALHDTNLDSLLKDAGIDTLLMGGVASDLVVQTTARAAHDMDYTVVVLEDMSAANDPAIHEAMMAALGRVARVEKVGDCVELN